MSISYALVLLGLGVFGCAVWALFWAIDDGQYDDVESHATSILEEEDYADPGPAEENEARKNGDIPHLLAKGDAPP
jgi:cbb3-type cytochrome oxidase maturation protein